MSRFILAVLVLLALLVVPAASVLAQPSCTQSTFPMRIGVSPKNNSIGLPAAYRYRYQATLRDAAGAPVVGWARGWIRLDFTQCPNAPAYVFPDGPSAANGAITWSNQLNFGGGGPCGVAVQIDPSMGGGAWATCARIPGFATNLNGGVRSPDNDGDGLIMLADLATFQAAFQNQFPMYQGDLAWAFDDFVSLIDVIWFAQHFVAP